MKHQFKYPNFAHSGQKGKGCENTYIETSVKLRPLAQLFVALEFKSSKYYKYSCGLNFRAPRFDLKLLVLQRSHIVFICVEKFFTVSFADLYGKRRGWVSFN